MEESLVCPICETENAVDATHCEVCGERLVPAEPGQEVGPEESVAEQLTSDGAEVVGFAVEDDEGDVGPADATAEGLPISEYDSEAGEDAPEAEPAGDSTHSEDGGEDSGAEETDDAAGGEMSDEDLDAEFEALEAEAGDDFDDDTPPDLPETSADDTDDAVMAAPADETADIDAVDFGEEGAAAAGQAEYLYSPLDGTAYHKDSPEYAEGFGPMGEELVAEPPEDVEVQHADAAPEPSEAGAASSDATFEDEYDDHDGDMEEDFGEAAAEAPAEREPSAEFKAAFQARQKERPTMEPLPEPGTYVEPATVTVYVDREPVLRHEIETDETLIGRKDPVADAYPDVDLSEFDPEAHVSRKHAYIYRQNKNYTLYAVSNSGTQLNDTLLELGDRKKLSDGDVIVLAGKIAMKFDVPDA